MNGTMSTFAKGKNSPEEVFIISRSVYNALHPLDQLMAQALEKIEKVRIVDEDDSIIVR